MVHHTAWDGHCSFHTSLHAKRHAEHMQGADSRQPRHPGGDRLTSSGKSHPNSKRMAWNRLTVQLQKFVRTQLGGTAAHCLCRYQSVLPRTGKYPATSTTPQITYRYVRTALTDTALSYSGKYIRWVKMSS